MKIFLILLIFICSWVNAYGQITKQKSINENRIDSVLLEVKNSVHDTITAKLYSIIGKLYEQIKPDSSILYYEKGIDLMQKTIQKKMLKSNEISSIETQKLNWNLILGNIYKDKGLYEKALEIYQYSLKSAKALNNNKFIAICLNNLGVAYYLMEIYDEAIDYFNKSLAIKKDQNDMKGFASNYANIGNVYRNIEKNEDALENYTKALSAFEKLADKLGISGCSYNAGLIYLDLGLFDKALELFLKALEIYSEMGNKRGTSICYQAIGNVYEDKGISDKALEYYTKSLKLKEELNDKKGIANYHTNTGLVYVSQGLYDKALESYKISLEINEELGIKKNIAAVLGNIAILYCQKADSLLFYNAPSNEISECFGLALEYANKTMKLAKEIHSVSIKKNTCLVFARIYIGTKKYKLTLRNYNELIDINNKNIYSNFSFMSEDEKELYFKTISKDYMEYYSFAIKHFSEFPTLAGEMYNNTIKNKGLLLKSSTTMRNTVINSNDTSLITIYKKWLSIRIKIAKMYSDETLNEIEIKNAESQSNDIEKSLIKKSKYFKDFMNLKNQSWHNVKSKLMKGEAAVEFIHFNYKGIRQSLYTDTVYYCALVLTWNSTSPKIVKLFTEKELKSILNNSNVNQKQLTQFNNKINDKWYDLYNLIWKPIEKELSNSKTIYLSPSGILHKISFSALCNEDNKYLCDYKNIVILGSTGDITTNNRNSTIDNVNIGLYGGINYNCDSTKNEVWKYLNGSKEEVLKIQEILNNNNSKAVMFIGDLATEENFKNTVGKSNLVHIATHGFYYPGTNKSDKLNDSTKNKNDIFSNSSIYGTRSFILNKNSMMRSGLVFAGANKVWNIFDKSDKADGILTAMEASNIDMQKTDLIVLSACETGLGDIKGSEGVYGLQRAFKMAGVKSIIMSLWNIPDKETSEFMVLFYDKLTETKKVRISFNYAQRQMRLNYPPSFWAAFVLIE